MIEPDELAPVGCPHGDPTCPCPDGDPCHYEGPDRWPCPNAPHVRAATHNHCHVEGCRYEETDQDGCGLALLGRRGAPTRAEVRAAGLAGTLVGNPEWACGAARFVIYNLDGLMWGEDGLEWEGDE